MAKNDWRNANSGTRTSMNQPYWLASGAYHPGDTTKLELQVGPGMIRFPYANQLVYSSGAQQAVLNNVAISTYYTLFVRSNGTFIVSGTTSATVPGPPRYDAEPLGTVYTGVSLGDANLVGPWNQGGGAQQVFEQRGQYLATTAGRQRLQYYDDTAILKHVLRTYDGSSTVNSLAIASVTVNTPAGMKNEATAMITWVPSGALSGAPSVLNLGPAFRIDPNSFSDDFTHCTDTHRYTVAQDPNTRGTPGTYNVHTTVLHGVDTTGVGSSPFTYVLRGYIDEAVSDASVGSIIIRDVRFIVRPGVVATSGVEPS